MPPLKVALCSLLRNRNREVYYNILILHSDLTIAHREDILTVSNGESKVEVHFIDVTHEAESVYCDIDGYITVATTYRLLLLSKLFCEYDKMLYLDSDIVVEGDISELYHINMNKVKQCFLWNEEGVRFEKKSI